MALRCCACGKKITGGQRQFSCSNGTVCGDCASKTRLALEVGGVDIPTFWRRIGLMSAEEVRESIAEQEHAVELHLAEIRSFQPTMNIEDIALFDDRSERVMLAQRLPDYSFKSRGYHIFDYAQLRGASLVENGQVAKAGGRALAGALIAGTTGAVIGAATSKGKGKVEIEVSVGVQVDSELRNYRIKLSNGPMRRDDSDVVRLRGIGNSIVSEIEKVVARGEGAFSTMREDGKVESLLKLKELLDEGLLTREEFTSAKVGLLGAGGSMPTGHSAPGKSAGLAKIGLDQAIANARNHTQRELDEERREYESRLENMRRADEQVKSDVVERASHMRLSEWNSMRFQCQEKLRTFELSDGERSACLRQLELMDYAERELGLTPEMLGR